MEVVIPTKYYADGDVSISKNGSFFYSTKNKIFTLPVGFYNIVGNLVSLGVNDYIPKLKPFEKSDFKNFSFYYAENPNIASVFDNGDVLIDPKAKEVDVIDLLLKGHEIGHSFYESELDCDLFAIEIAKLLGYNDTQIDAGFNSISYTERLPHIHKRLTK